MKESIATLLNKVLEDNTQLLVRISKFLVESEKDVENQKQRKAQLIEEISNLKEALGIKE